MVSLLLQNRLNHPASVSLNLKSKRLGNINVRAQAKGHHLPKICTNSCRVLTNTILRNIPVFSTHSGVERTHKSAIELVKNNLFFFNIFIDMLNNKIQVLINTSVQDKFISNNRKRMIQVAVIH